MKEEKKYCRILTIAGSDSGGGAGIQADLKTFSALGCYGMSAITALTAQNTMGVRGVHAAPAAFVLLQMQAVLEDIGADAAKIGMLHDAEIVRAVAQGLRAYSVQKIVLDPVMIAKSGDKLIAEEALGALKKELMPLVTVLTPNIPEAETLLGRSLKARADIEQAGRDLCQWGARAVVVKGGHAAGSMSSDYVYVAAEDTGTWLESERISSSNLHGTGCTFSAAIACGLGCGLPVLQSVREAKAYLSSAIRAGSSYKIGEGHGPVHHFHSIWKE